MKTIKNKKTIKYIFKNEEDFKNWIKNHAIKSKHITTFVMGFYNKFIPNWDKIEKVNGFPVVSKSITQYIYSVISQYYNDLDGLIWLQHGFNIDL